MLQNGLKCGSISRKTFFIYLFLGCENFSFKLSDGRFFYLKVVTESTEK